jgi:hypothetical protein
MRFEVTPLRYWKEEYGCEERCEDAWASNAQSGLFAVSDGVGEMSYSNYWSDILVKRFIEEPLLSGDAFEAKYWVREAQKSFSIPENLPYYARDKAREGSSATLVCARFYALGGAGEGARERLGNVSAVARADASATRCRLLAMGDSCALVWRDGNLLFSFPNSSSEDFKRAPVCFPTRGYRASWWKHVVQEEITFCDGDVLVLATDAVAKWLLRDDEALRRERLALLLAQTPDSWPAIVQSYRRTGCLDDDDSTALIVRVMEPSGDPPPVPQPYVEARSTRRERFQQACAERAEIEMAILFGDGSCFQNAPPDGETMRSIREGQSQAQAQWAILEALERTIRRGRNNRQELQALWEKYRDVLSGMESAENIRQSLKALGVVVEAERGPRTRTPDPRVAGSGGEPSPAQSAPPMALAPPQADPESEADVATTTRWPLESETQFECSEQGVLGASGNRKAQWLKQVFHSLLRKRTPVSGNVRPSDFPPIWDRIPPMSPTMQQATVVPPPVTSEEI